MLLPDPLDATHTYLSKISVTDQNGAYHLGGIASGKYRLYAWEDIEAGSQFDSEAIRPLEALGTKVTLDVNGHLTQALTEITVAQMEEAKPK